MNKEEFIIKANKVHGNKYDYSLIDYKNNKTKICIICPEHGEFWQLANSHLKGCGCPKCAAIERGIKQRDNKDSFIKKAKEIHHDKYDYSKVEYVNSSTKVCIICPEHGEFWQTPSSHLNGRGCPKCGMIKRNSCKRANITDFINNANKVHHDKYDYSKVEYVNNRVKIRILCHKKDNNGIEHGEFWQTPSSHLNGRGCPKCKKDAISNFQRIKKFFPLTNTEDIKYKTNDDLKFEFIKKANKVHDSKYDYSYVINNKRIHKFSCRKNLLLRKYTDMGLTEDMTEKNMTEKIGIFRIWNCGLIKYKWLNKI